MKLFNKVAIIGTGLIGGSFALALKKKGIASQVVGVSRKRATLAEAKKIGAIDKGSQGLGIVTGADLVVFAAPVEAIIKLAPRVKGLIGKDSIVIDVGSTKDKIVSCLDKIFPNYVGTHPLAGSEKRGVRNARAGIFRGSLCILTPTGKTRAATLKKVNLLWKRLGTKTVFLKPGVHDKILSFTSHLPHIIAFSLIASIPGKYLGMSSAGLRDTTRIAASDNEIWEQILLSNGRHIIGSIRAFEKNLSAITSAIQKKNKRALGSILTQARRKRDTF